MSCEPGESLGHRLEQCFREGVQKDLAEEIAVLKPLVGKGMKDVKFGLRSMKEALMLALVALPLLGLTYLVYANDGEMVFVVCGLLAVLACTAAAMHIFFKAKKIAVQLDSTGMKLTNLDRVIPWGDMLEIIVDDPALVAPNYIRIQLPPDYPLVMVKEDKRVRYTAETGELDFMPPGKKRDDYDFFNIFINYFEGGVARARLKALGAD